MMRSHFSVLLLIFLLKAGIFTSPLTGTEDVEEGSTFSKTVIKTSQLEKHDQVIVRFYRSFNESELCAQYFCYNGECVSQLGNVGHFQVQADSLVLIMPKINITNSGLYIVLHNGDRNVLNFTLVVKGRTSAMPDSTKAAQEMPNNSTRGIHIAVAVLIVLLVVVSGFICWKKRKACWTWGMCRRSRTEQLDKGEYLEDSDPGRNGLLDKGECLEDPERNGLLDKGECLEDSDLEQNGLLDRSTSPLC